MALDGANKLSRIAGPANAASGTSTIFTGTAAHIYTIKSIRLVNTTGTAITVKIGINAITDAALILPATSIAANSELVDDTLTIIAGTENIQINTTATGVTYTICALDQS